MMMNENQRRNCVGTVKLGQPTHLSPKWVWCLFSLTLYPWLYSWFFFIFPCIFKSTDVQSLSVVSLQQEGQKALLNSQLQSAESEIFFISNKVDHKNDREMHRVAQNRFTFVSMWNTEFVFVLLFINYYTNCKPTFVPPCRYLKLPE